MRLVSADAVAESMIRQIDVGSGIMSPTAPETVAALLRRVAGFLCPCPIRTLVDTIYAASGPWLGEDARDLIRETLGDMVLHGDLVELQARGTGPARPIFLAAPVYVARESGTAFLQGIVPDHPTGLPSEMTEALRQRGVIRWLEPRSSTQWDVVLEQLGFAPLDPERWYGAPAPVTAREYCARAAKRLNSAPTGGDADSLKIINPTADPTYFTGRWIEAGGSTGRFIGRRERRFGSPIWCHVEISHGQILRLIDLYDEDDPAAGRDEGLHLQMALDACAGTPQRFSVRDEAGGSDPAIDFFSSIPSWAERRLLAVGQRSMSKGRGALFTITLPRAEVEEEVRFLRRALWLEPFV
jgi:hypothetical protein